MKRYNINRKRVITAILVLLVIIAGTILILPLFSRDAAPEDTGAVPAGTDTVQAGADAAAEGEAQTEPEPEPEPDIVSINILAVGDTMTHKSQIEAARNQDGTYSFADNFQYVAPYISAADIALCNVETTFGGEPYTGYPNFSSPDVLAQDLKNAGFDIAITSNNHMHDKGLSGMKRTLEVLRENGFLTVGSNLTPEEPKYCMTEVYGVKVAVLAYTYQTPSDDGTVRINGVIMGDEDKALMNTFGYENIEAEYAKIGAAADAAREAGADIVILYYHWGEEYQLKANTWEHTIADYTAANMDVDMIFASHPHNLQEAQYVGNIPCYFSMGNFISNQRRETLGEGYEATEIGVLAGVTVDFDRTNREIIGTSMHAIPTWVDKYSSGGRTRYAVIPLDENLESNPTLAESGHLSRAQKAKEDGYAILGIAQ